MMPTLTCKAPAKLNLFLHLYEQRDDGYHDLDTYFQLIDLCDEIDISLRDDGQIMVDNPLIAPCLKQVNDDLCYRAAELFFASYHTKSITQIETVPGVNITVHKHIPDGAGLGGGSSDAASVLLGLNALCQQRFSQAELLQMARQLGADVAVFVVGQSSFASGIGDAFYRLTERGQNPEHHILSKLLKAIQSPTNYCVVQPSCKVQTQNIFHAKQLTKRPKTSTIPRAVAQLGDNDFEAVVLQLQPALVALKPRLQTVAPFYLTGTGACYYSCHLPDDLQKQQQFANEIRLLEGVAQVFVVSSLITSPSLQLR